MSQRPPELHVVDDPAAAVAALLAAQATAGGSIVLTGGTTPAHAYRARPSSRRTGARRRSGGATSAACRPTTSARTTGWRRRRCSTGSRVQPPRRAPDARASSSRRPQPTSYDARTDGVELDLLLLGLGGDGHMASLFPGSPQLEVEDRRVTSGPAGPRAVRRPRHADAARRSARRGRIVFLVAGEGKADAVARAFGGEIAGAVPASLARLRARAGRGLPRRGRSVQTMSGDEHTVDRRRRPRTSSRSTAPSSSRRSAIRCG